MLRAALLAFALTFAASLPAAAQCSMCKESLKEESARPLALGFKYSIYGMVCMPFLLTAGIVVMILRSDRQMAERRRLAALAAKQQQQPA